MDSNLQLLKLVNNMEELVKKGELKEITGFNYLSFLFEFNISGMEMMNKYMNFLKSYVFEGKVLVPWDICNFFIANDIKYKVKFKYNMKIGIQENFLYFRTVLALKKEKIKYNIRSSIKKNILKFLRYLTDKINAYIEKENHSERLEKIFKKMFYSLANKSLKIIKKI